MTVHNTGGKPTLVRGDTKSYIEDMFNEKGLQKNQELECCGYRKPKRSPVYQFAELQCGKNKAQREKTKVIIN